MREGWEHKKIKEVCSFIGDGDWIESKDQSDFGIRLIQTGNIGTGIYRDKADKVKYISNITFSQLSCTEIFEGDCLLSRLPEPIGRSCLLPKLNVRTITAVDCTILRFKENILPIFFIYYTQSNSYYNDILSKTTGTTRKRISRKNLEKIGIPVPPKSTQLSIVSELDKINELIRIKKEQLKDYDTLAQSIFYEMFGDPVENEKGWEVKQLKDVSTLLNGRAYKQQELLDKGKYKVLRVGNFFTNSNYYYSDLELDDDRYCEYGDLLFAWSASFGAFIWGGDKVIYHYHIWKVLFEKGSLNIQYYRYLLNTMTSFFMNDVHGIGMVHLTKSGMEQYKLPLPPLSLQQSFAHKIEQIEKQKAALQNTITDLETLLASRMQYWFGGIV